MNEFELIRRYFAALAPDGEGVSLGIGDDAALLEVPAAQQLVVSTDMLVAGRHFPEATAPNDIGWKSLAVNLSDLAAMGAEARWLTLALSLPQADPSWVEAFAQGLGALARASGVALVGGDTTRGPLTVTVTAMGLVPRGTALRRDGAQPGDRVCVTGTLGDAAAGLAGAGTGAAASFLRQRLDRPSPRLRWGQALRGIASAAIDLSDGLLSDLGHVADASGVGAEIDAAALPASPALLSAVPEATRRWPLQASGGDDYELCLCVPPSRLDAAHQACPALHEIGWITSERGVRLRLPDGKLAALDRTGFDHFA